MPIKDWSKYPPNWKSLSAGVKSDADWKCEQCEVAHGDIGYRDSTGQFHAIEKSHQGDEDAAAAEALGYKIIKIVLTTAHLDQNPENNDRSNLKALCQRCHLNFDRPFNEKKQDETRREKKYGDHRGQYKLF